MSRLRRMRLCAEASPEAAGAALINLAHLLARLVG